MTEKSKANLVNIFLCLILLSTSASLPNHAVATGFDPFRSAEDKNISTSHTSVDQGPVIPQIELNNNDISVAFQIISDATGWSIFPTRQVSMAKISFWAKEITAKELLDTVVEIGGFTYYRDGKTITVMTYDEYMFNYGLAKKIIALKYGDADSISGAIRPFFSKLGKNVAHKESNSIILYDSNANLAIITGIIEKLDVPPTDELVIEVIALKYADAEILAEILQQVLTDPTDIPASAGSRPADNTTAVTKTPAPQPDAGSSEKTSIFVPQATVGVYSIGHTNQIIVKAYKSDITRVRKLIKELDIYVEPTSRNYHFTYVDAAQIHTGLERILNLSGRFGQGQRGNLRGSQTNIRREGISLIEETNSILITGPPSAHRIMASIVENIDIPSTYEAGVIRVYKLENADVEEIATALRELLRKEEERQEISRDVRFATEPGRTAPHGPGGQEVVSSQEFIPQIEARVTTSTSTNSVIVRATAKQHRELEQLIKELDKRRKQVLIKAIIVEVITNNSVEIGVDLEHLNANMLVFTSFGLSTINPSTGVRDITVSPGGTAAVLRPDKVHAILRALESNGNAKISSAPQILVNDNAVGLIHSVAEEPITQINASDTVATTSFAGFVEAGTQFAITPHISENDYLRVEYTITLNSFGTRPTDPSIPPPRSTSSIQSEATVPNGHTIIVGGLQMINESENVDKIPILGDIPILGLAFRSTNIVKQYKTSYLFITPTILEDLDFADLKDISNTTLEQIEAADNDDL